MRGLAFAWNLNMRKFFLTTALALSGSALLDFSGPVLADFDVSPAVVSGKIVTDAYADATGATIVNVRVFGFEFGEDPLDPFFAEDPGFHPLPGVGVPGGTTISAKSFSALSYWSGSSFGALPAGESLDITRGSTTVTLNASGFAGAIPIDTTDLNGEFDQHLESTLKGVGPNDPSVGIYLFNLTLGAPGLTDSDPMYVLFNNGADRAEFDSAVAFARNQFAPGSTLVPEPTSLAGVALLGLAMKRKRRSICS